MDRDDRNHEPKARVSVARRNLKEAGGGPGRDEQNGWWRMAHSLAAHEGMTPAWFTAIGLACPTDRYAALQH